MEYPIELKQYIRNIPDFPRPGILFRDLTPLLRHPPAFRHTVEQISRRLSGKTIDSIAGVEARGFLLAAPLALQLEKPLVLVRKEGKLPYETHSARYALEYGEAVVQVHTDSITSGQKVLVVDDLLATGGTLEATTRLVESLGGEVVGIAVLMELTELHGRERLKGYEVISLIEY